MIGDSAGQDSCPACTLPSQYVEIRKFDSGAHPIPSQIDVNWFSGTICFNIMENREPEARKVQFIRRGLKSVQKFRMTVRESP